MPNWCRNTLSVEGPKEDIKAFCLQAHGHTQSYNEFNIHGAKWPIHDEIRLRSIVESLPEPGNIVAFSFHALFPVPDDYRRYPYDDSSAQKLGELLGESRISGGYNWESKNWGVKWGGCDTELVHKEDNFLQYEFNTAWGPPIDFLHKISDDWSNLSFKLSYEEPGMGFAGEAGWDDGCLVYEEEHEVEEYEEEEE